MRRALLPVGLQEKLIKLLIDLTAWRNACITSLLVTNVENNFQVKQTTHFAISEIITNFNKHTLGISCMQKHQHEHFCDSEHSAFRNDVID